jgi:hypothetical protein
MVLMEKPRATGDATRTRDVPPYPGTPRWVYAFALIVIVPLAVFVIRHVTGGGFGGHTHWSR